MALAGREDNRALYAALAGAGVVLVGAVVAVTRMGAPPPPPPPAPLPVRPTGPALQAPVLYRGVLDQDAALYGVPPTTPEALARPLEYREELDAPRTLRVGESFETESLRLRLKATKAWAKSEGGQGFRYDHLVLSVENLAGEPVAYRIDTSLEEPGRCRSKAALAHNAVALAVDETIERTECLYHPGMALTVARVETMSLPPLGYYYVSRLLPRQIGLDDRTSAGHLPPKDARLCKYVPWREIEVSGAKWADVIDFYARHNCDEYAFHRSYRRRTEVGPLPDVEAAAPPPAAPPPAATPAPAPAAATTEAPR